MFQNIVMYTKIIGTSHRSNKVMTTFETNLIEAFF